MPVKFDEQNFMRNTTFDQPKGLSGKLIGWGVAKDQKSANVILTIVLALVVILTGFVMFSGGGSNIDSTETYYPEGGF